MKTLFQAMASLLGSMAFANNGGNLGKPPLDDEHYQAMQNLLHVIRCSIDTSGCPIAHSSLSDAHAAIELLGEGNRGTDHPPRGPGKDRGWL